MSREEEILQKLFDGKSYAAVGREYGISPERTRQILWRELRLRGIAIRKKSDVRGWQLSDLPQRQEICWPRGLQEKVPWADGLTTRTATALWQNGFESRDQVVEWLKTSNRKMENLGKKGLAELLVWALSEEEQAQNENKTRG